MRLKIYYVDDNFIDSLDYELLIGKHTISDLHVFINYIQIYKR